MSLENLKKLKAKQDQSIAIESSTGSAHAPMTKSDLKKEQVLSLIHLHQANIKVRLWLFKLNQLQE